MVDKHHAVVNEPCHQPSMPNRRLDPQIETHIPASYASSYHRYWYPNKSKSRRSGNNESEHGNEGEVDYMDDYHVAHHVVEYRAQVAQQCCGYGADNV